MQEPSLEQSKQWQTSWLTQVEQDHWEIRSMEDEKEEEITDFNKEKEGVKKRKGDEGGAKPMEIAGSETRIREEQWLH